MKKLLTGILALALLISLCACGDAANTGNAGNKVPEGNGGSVSETKSENENDSVADNQTDFSTLTPTEEVTEAPTAAGADLSDVLLNLTIELYQGGKLSASESIDLEYDAKGNTTVGFILKNENSDTLINPIRMEYEYDNSGRVIFSRNPMDDKTTYTYDGAGHISSARVETYRDTYTVSYSYDDDENLIRILQNDDDKSGFRTEDYQYTYENGKLIRMYYHSSSSGATVTEEYTYDNTGRLASVLYTGQFGGIILTNHTYDDAGNLISSEHLSELRGEYSLFRTDVYTYDAKGRILSQESDIYGRTKYVLTYTYGDY